MTNPIDTTPEAIAALLDGVTPGPWPMQTLKTSCGVCHKIGPWPHKWRGGKEMSACIYDDYPSPAEGTDTMIANARFIAAARELVPALAAEIARLTAERDEARAQVAMAYEVAARLCEDTAQEALDESGTCSRTLWTWFHGQSSAISTFTPSDAAAALAARDAAMRNEGRRQAAELLGDSNAEYQALDRILAALEPEGGE